ncbi:MAG: exo-alpha-sialidase [Candidatus Bathyarchaeia archaeon]
MDEKPLFRAREIFKKIPTRPFHHAPTVVELPDEDLLAAWYGGSYEGARDVAILSSRFKLNDNTWTEPSVLIDTPDRSDGNPVLFLDNKGVVWLFYVTMLGEWWKSCIIKYIKSADGAHSWSTPIIMRHKMGWMTRNKPIILGNGDILLPVYDEERWHSMVMISEDCGKTWRRYGDISTEKGVIQPTVVQLSDQSLLMYMRTGGLGGYIWESTSTNNGRTWTPASKTHLRNPNSGIEMIRTSSGNLVLAFNDTSRGRTPLNVALSTDEGITWPYKKELETGPGEFSYPSLIQTKDGSIHVVYTHRRGEAGRSGPRLRAYGANIKHVILNEAWITS